MKNKKVAFFSRVSTLDQHTSIENQEVIFKQWLERNPDCEFYKLYEDEGISGAKAYKRVNWLQMIEDGKNGMFDIIVCKSFSRFGRNIVDTISVIKELMAKGVRCIFLEDGLDSQNDMAKFGLFSWLAEQEAQKTSERIKQVWDSFNQEGKVHVTLAPYGYDYNKELKNFIVNEIEASVIRKIFNLYLAENGFNKIAQILIDENIPTKRGGKWAGATIKGILTNEFYIGTLVQGKTRTIDATMKESRKIDKEEWYKHQDNHEAIIDKETFKKVNDKIEERSSRAKNFYTKVHGNKSVTYVNSKVRNSNKSLFSNILICGECGSKMTIKRKKKDNFKPYYQCIEYDRRSLKCGHSSNRINESFLIKMIEEELRNLSKNNFRALKEIQVMNRQNKNNDKIEKELKAINKKIDKQVEIGNDLLMHFSNGIVNQLQFKLQNESLQKALGDLVKRKEQLEKELKEDTTKEEEKIIYEGIEGILNKPVEEWSNADLKNITDSIVVYIDGTIKLNVKYFN